mmetsp:Transcript_2105/g.7308  ORF Transcript_2105/g.7308 Transcript_2105/m.7308 type:complete len:210 (-) Transcript_2105:3638-4267(-)
MAAGEMYVGTVWWLERADVQLVSTCSLVPQTFPSEGGLSGLVRNTSSPLTSLSCDLLPWRFFLKKPDVLPVSDKFPKASTVSIPLALLFGDGVVRSIDGRLTFLLRDLLTRIALSILGAWKLFGGGNCSSSVSASDTSTTSLGSSTPLRTTTPQLRSRSRTPSNSASCLSPGPLNWACRGEGESVKSTSAWPGCAFPSTRAARLAVPPK